MQFPLWRGFLFGWLLCLAAASWAKVSSFDAVRQGFQSSETLVLDRHGEVIHRLRTNFGVRRGQWVPLSEISPALQHALVRSEDRRFYEHSGVDWRAVSAAAWANLWHTRTRGASTITMQLAGLLDSNLRLRGGGRSVRQKMRQAWMATELESAWRKDQILEAYLNLVPFRGELVGIDALSRTLFGKAAHGLQAHEAAITAALVRAPNARPAAVAQRACGVLKAMQQNLPPNTCLMLDMQTELVLTRHAWPASEGLAPHFAQRLLSQRADSKQLGAPNKRACGATNQTTTLTASCQQVWHSTLDARLQRLAQRTLQAKLRELKGRHVQDGAVVVLDNASGDVLAWVGSSGDELSRTAEVDSVLARRQPGSTLKPFLYAQAIAERRITAASLLDDSPAHLQTAAGLYIPQNYDRHFKGWISARTALASSLNVPAVRTLVMVSPESFAQILNRLGLALQESGSYYGYSLALGSAEVSLLQLTNAYRALANGGRYCPVHLRPSSQSPRNTTAPEQNQAVDTCQQVLDPGATFIVGNILSDNNARTRTFGTDSILATRFWTAVKTGTSKDMRDNWAVGWSERYTVGVWVGNTSGGAMWDVSGTSGAAPIWAALMHHLHARTPSRAPSPPNGVVKKPVHYSTHLEADRTEWFLEQTEQGEFTIDSSPQDRLHPASAATQARISAPQDGTIIALDPDIPPRNQRLTLIADTAGHAARELHWWLDDRLIGSGSPVHWMPWPGQHVLQLRDAHGAVQDTRHIEVRGAAVRASAKQKK